MPIQFRCQYCRQLLGISKSRAGSAVDCPACGRTLRVPSAEGGVESTDTSSLPLADVSLRTALEELSSLTSLASQTSPREALSSAFPLADRPRVSASEGDVDRDSMRIVPLSAVAQNSSEPVLSEKSQSEPVLRPRSETPAAEDVQPVMIPGTVAPGMLNATVQRKHEQQRPADLASALQVLTDPQTSLGSLSRSPATEVAPDRWRRPTWLMGSAVAVLISFGIGVVAGRAFVAELPEQGQGAADVTAGAVGREVVAVAEIPAGGVHGQVMYADEAGTKKPDSEALLLLVPAENIAGLKLDARPLREVQASDARRAVEAAIHVLKGSVTRAAADGTFQLERRYSGPGKLLIISRHASRPVSEAVEEDAANTLAAWFESPSQLTGRLQVQEKSVPAAEPGKHSRVEVTFGRP